MKNQPGEDNRSGELPEIIIPTCPIRRGIEPCAWEEFGKEALDPSPELTAEQVMDLIRGPVELPPPEAI